ncbi:MAG TPA: sulfurtransferase [Nitrospiraceae bacterium]|jgi:thiosulfate/3-mercaptopyruvate sulfurtransferase|nr:sulfurtransferase [Nitrospiraceae bacterium]
MMHPLLIDCETLDQNLGRADLVVIDVRGTAAYAFGGHIPGAVHATWHEFSDPNAAAKGLLDPDLSRLEKKIQALGISHDSDVVIYSNPFDNWGDEGRMFWMLQYLGHSKLRILDGGWVKWVAEKRRYDYGTVNPKPGDFRIAPNPDVIVFKEELKKLVKRPHPETVIADARSLEEYAGKEIQGIPRAGHIPSAISLPWNAFLNKDATVKDFDALKESLEDKGLHESHEVICYCTGGVRSAWLYFVLKLAGYEKVRNYPGSWWEWSRDFAAPVETDARLLHRIIGPTDLRPT